MTMDWGYTVEPSQGGGDIAHALAEADAPRHGDQTPGEWVKSNLFNTWYNSIITVVFGTLALVGGFYLARFLFVTARWEPVRLNMELFMVGTYPRSERTRIIVQLLTMSGAGGILVGYLKRRAEIQADEAGIEFEPMSVRTAIATYGALGAFVIVALLIGARSIGPYVLTVGCIAAGIAGYMATRPLKLPAKLVLLTPIVLAAGTLMLVQDLNNQAAYALAIAGVLILVLVNLVRTLPLMLSAGLFVGVVGFQAMSGSGGIAWLFLTIALTPIAMSLLNQILDRLPAWAGWIGVAIVGIAFVRRMSVNGMGAVAFILLLVGIAVAISVLQGDPVPAIRVGGFVVVAFVVWLGTSAVGLEGIDWKDWSGLHLNLVVTSTAIVLAFPIGLLLALGRRSSLPVLRWMATAYIELIRGVPLISLLLMGQFFIGFFLNTDDPLSNVTRATTAITMFSAAYIAEIVRGGLQSVPSGQTEAGQALGMRPGSITRLLVLPQALRNVIPAMVGQFISLFKDTSLLSIIAITEYLGVREIIHAQEAFRGFGIAETLLFVGFGFWAVSFTMSRESQRLERRLGVGVR